LFGVLGVEGSGLPVELYHLGPENVFIELESADAVAAVRPDFGALGEVTPAGVNTFSRDGERWKTRMFAPLQGVNEDPATGSAAGPLAMHLARHGRIEFGQEIEISQGTEIGRPSKLYAAVEGSAGKVERVRVGGSAMIVARGEFKIP
jgi:trans-2,3-dihydro-3-hydroxyanthranilate isomerase